ncbi:MAG: glycosyltransferase [Nitrososphaerota archaeon]
MVHDIELSKGAYILWSLAKEIKRLDQSFSPHLIGYHEMVLHCQSTKTIYQKIYPILYTFFFGGKGRRLVHLYEPIRATKYVARNFDAILASATALEWKGIATLVKRGYPTILWDIDSPNIDYGKYRSIVANKNVLLFCYSQGGVKIWREYGVEPIPLPLGADTSIFYPLGKSDATIDILFTGRFLKDRIQGYQTFLYPLIKRFKKSVVLAGSGWEKVHAAREAYVLPNSHYSRLNKLYNSAKVCLNIHRDQSRTCFGAINLRTFEILAARRLQIVDHVKGIDSFFINRQELIVVEDTSEIIEWVERVLYDQKEAARIANSGYRRINSEHTIRHRAKSVINILRDFMQH